MILEFSNENMFFENICTNQISSRFFGRFSYNVKIVYLKNIKAIRQETLHLSREKNNEKTPLKNFKQQTIPNMNWKNSPCKTEKQ